MEGRIYKPQKLNFPPEECWLSFQKKAIILIHELDNEKFRTDLIIMSKSYWLINSKRTEVKRFIKNDKSIDGVCEYMFVDTGKIVGNLGKEPPVMQTTVSVDIDLAREIYERLLSQGWMKTEEVWRKSIGE